MKTSFNFTIEALALTLVVTVKCILWARDKKNVFTFTLTDYAGNEIDSNDEFIFFDPEVRDELDEMIDEHLEMKVREDAKRDALIYAHLIDDEIESIEYLSEVDRVLRLIDVDEIEPIPFDNETRVIEIEVDEEEERRLEMLADMIDFARGEISADYYLRNFNF